MEDLVLLGGLILISLAGQSLSLHYLIHHVSQIQDSAFFTLAMVLIMLAAFTKSAQVPFYIWLPDAMEAPTPVSAYLHSATMVKSRVISCCTFNPIIRDIRRMDMDYYFSRLNHTILGFIKCNETTRFERILAFSTVSQLGMIMSMLGIGAISYHFEGSDSQLYIAGFTAAAFHLINHATFKGALFMITGAMMRVTAHVM